MRARSIVCLLLISYPVVLAGCPDCYSEAHPGACSLEDGGAAPPATSSCSTAEAADQAEAALAVLESACYRCHGGGGSIEGGFNYVMDPARMIEQGKIDLEDPESSRIYARMSQGEMPPAAEEARPSDADIAAVLSWIRQGGACDPRAIEPHDFISNAELFKVLQDDLEQQSPSERQYIRYVSLVHLRNAGATTDELETYRVGLNKLLNSLSLGGGIVNPTPVVGYEAALFRINLEDYAWDSSSRFGLVDGWEQLVKRDPYAFQYDDEAFEYLQREERTRVPVMNGDWLVFAGSVSPLYEEVLELPATEDEFLERFGGVDRAEGVRKLNVARAGFYQSGVSLHNRIIERHSAGGDDYCWVSYDFASSSGTGNIFAHPLNDEALFLGEDGVDFYEDDGFVPAGGEMFCTLPNGLQVYYLANDVGAFISEGPINVVSDPNNEEEGYVVQNGRSCMNCHYAGTIPKEDEVEEFVLETDYFGFDSDELYAIKAIYDREGTSEWLEADRELFLSRVDLTETPRVYETEPVFALARAFSQPLDEARIMAELGLDPTDKDLSDLLNEADAAEAALKDDLNQVFGPSGTVDRDAFLPLVQRLLCVANNQDLASCPDRDGACSTPDFDLDGDGALDVVGLPCPEGFTCLEDTAVDGEDVGACVEE